MIGVIANPVHSSVVREFFELFKTPWEFYRSGSNYDVLLCSGSTDIPVLDAPLVIIYGGVETHADSTIAASTASSSRILSYKGIRLPIYSGNVTFDSQVTGLLIDTESLLPSASEAWHNGAKVVRVGYDLFQEVRHLLTAGQPATNAPTPTIDLHIAFLRDLILAAGVPLLEIPPFPHGYRFIACLTHDVDHPYIRLHKFDHTMLGFLYRALIGSMVNLVRNRISLRNLLSNWLAALKLPFVYLGMAKDFWSAFDRYIEIEGDRPSTFFLIPFRNTPGRTSNGIARRLRGTPYAVDDLADQIQRLLAANREIGLHGIDAWIDSVKGRQELNAIRLMSDKDIAGVRIHWLYFDEQSPGVLERAGASYDSTVGYNETVGFRAGTGQAYKPLNAGTLLELPLHVMDTALFYPSHLHLSPAEAARRVGNLIENFERQGGCLTINWHDRSIAPERLWTRTYEEVIQQLTDREAWFATAAHAAAWFRMRRSATFETNSKGEVRVTAPANSGENLPRLMLRCWGGSLEPEDVVLPIGVDIPLPRAHRIDWPLKPACVSAEI